MGLFLARVNKHVERPLLCVAKVQANAFSPCSFSLPMDTFQVSPRDSELCDDTPRDVTNAHQTGDATDSGLRSLAQKRSSFRRKRRLSSERRTWYNFVIDKHISWKVAQQTSFPVCKNRGPWKVFCSPSPF